MAADIHRRDRNSKITSALQKNLGIESRFIFL